MLVIEDQLAQRWRFFWPIPSTLEDMHGVVDGVLFVQHRIVRDTRRQAVRVGVAQIQAGYEERDRIRCRHPAVVLSVDVCPFGPQAG